MAPSSRGAATLVAGVLLVLPLFAMATVLLLLAAAAGAGAAPTSAACEVGGTGQTVGPVALDAEQVGNAGTIVTVTAARGLPPYAAVIAVATAYTESRLHNTTTQTDHDSEGLFQQRVSIYTKPIADDPVRATTAFLDRLTSLPNCPPTPVGVDAQNVQHSAYGQRYQLNAGLAQQLVGQFWPTATATATDSGAAPVGATARGGPRTAAPVPGGGVPAICAGAGGAIPGTGGAEGIVGPHGNNVAGTTTIPAGLTITGSAPGAAAVRYALAQLGKPYLWAGAGPNAFDCSGLTLAAWAAAGVALPHSAAAQTGAGTPEPTNLTQAVAGDLVFIPGADGTPTHPGHVGMVAGYRDAPDGRHLYLIQAPMTGVPVELTEATRWAGQIVAVRHIQ